MLNLSFYPESSDSNLIRAASQYQGIWDQRGAEIQRIIEQVSGLRFRQEFFNALVFEGPSDSYPLRFRASYRLDQKQSCIVHELCHRLPIKDHLKRRDLSPHFQIDLVLYDIWVELWGPDFAQEQVQLESKHPQPYYKNAWDWALAKTKAERQQAFRDLVATDSRV